MISNLNPSLPWQLVTSWADFPDHRESQSCCKCLASLCIWDIWGHLSFRSWIWWSFQHILWSLEQKSAVSMWWGKRISKVEKIIARNAESFILFHSLQSAVLAEVQPSMLLTGGKGRNEPAADVHYLHTLLGLTPLQSQLACRQHCTSPVSLSIW